MRVTIMALAGALLLGLFLLPATARAAHTVTITPPAVPPGGIVTITGAGFTPDAKLELFAVVGIAPAMTRVKVADLTGGADGGFTTTLRVPGFFGPAPVPLIVVAGGDDLAQATFTVTDAPSIAPEALTIAPTAAPAGTRFRATGIGLPAGVAVKVFTTESAKGPARNFRQVATPLVPADGRVSFTIETNGYHPESYDVIIFGPGGPAIGFPLVLGQFTVTAPSMPGLPNTGDGGRATGTRGGWPVLVMAQALLGLGIAGGLGCASLRRRRSRRANCRVA